MKTCTICDKGSVRGGVRSFLRSHYNPTSAVRKYPNLQWAKLPASTRQRVGRGSPQWAVGVRAKVCVRCMKKLHTS